MYFVYVISSERVIRYYVGMTGTPDERLRQHNSGRVVSTKAYRPWRLVYFKGFESRLEASDFEKYLKIRVNKEKLLRSLGLEF